MNNYQHLRNIIKETIRRIAVLNLPYEEEYRCQLKFLNSKEKALVKQAFIKQEWNIGSTRVLAMLQEMGVLNATELLLFMESEELLQDVMNDLLESEYSLLAHVVFYANQSHSVSASTVRPNVLRLGRILQDSFSALWVDLLENPNIIPTNYLQQLRHHLSAVDYRYLKDLHLRMLLYGEYTELSDAFAEQLRWREELQATENSTRGKLLAELVQDGTQTLAALEKAITSTETVRWKLLLHCLYLSARDAGDEITGYTSMKQLLKNIFRQAVGIPSDSNKFRLLFVVVREICSGNEKILGSYPAWYKQTIGEMHYRLSRDEFLRTMELLSGLTLIDGNLQALKVHANIAISAPVKCNDHVLSYKQLCRTRIDQLEQIKSQTATGAVEVC